MIWRFMSAAACLLLLCGCGARDPFGYVKVSGRVTYEDGSRIPAERIVLTFVPQGLRLGRQDDPRRPAQVDVASGAFSVVSSNGYDDGLVAGKHKVLVLTLDRRKVPTPLVPSEYRDPEHTPLEVDTAHAPFTLKVRKPK